MTEEELRAQLDLADARLDVANGRSITPERYRDLIASLQRGREAKAAQMAADTKDRAKARRAAAKAAPMTTEQLRSLFQGALEATEAEGRSPEGA